MSEFNFKSSICTSREQSEKLLALGLKKETADMCLSKVNVFCQTFDLMSPHSWTKEQLVSETWYPAWSLHRLIEMCPHNMRGYICKNIFDEKYAIDEQFNELILTIKEYIKEGYFNKEYLVCYNQDI